MGIAHKSEREACQKMLKNTPKRYQNPFKVCFYSSAPERQQCWRSRPRALSKTKLFLDKKFWSLFCMPRKITTNATLFFLLSSCFGIMCMQFGESFRAENVLDAIIRRFWKTSDRVVRFGECIQLEYFSWPFCFSIICINRILYTHCAYGPIGDLGSDPNWMKFKTFSMPFRLPLCRKLLTAPWQTLTIYME